MSEQRSLTKVRHMVDDALAHWGAYFTQLSPTHYRATQGSAEVYVKVVEEPSGVAMVRVRAPVSYGAELDVMAMRFLLEANDNMPIATFGVDEKGTVFVGQSLHGEWLQPEELRQTVRAVAIAANCLDELISERTSGKRSIDVKPWLKDL
jgi:hypothetical protein